MRHTLGLQNRAAKRVQWTVITRATKRRWRQPAAHGIDAPTKSSSAPARPKRRRACRRDERHHCKHELADVRQRRRANDHIHSMAGGYKVVQMKAKEQLETLPEYDAMLVKDQKVPAVASRPISSVVQAVSQ